jgi:positive regulator of sigma E activity
MGCKKEDKDLMTQAVNLICAKPGDSVRLESSTAQTLLLAITLYLVPVLLLLVGMMIHPLLGIGLLIGSLLLLIPFQKIFAKRGGIRVTIAAILPKE